MAFPPKSSPLHVLAGLPLAEWRMLLRALGLVVAVRAALWVLPFGTVRRLLERAPAQPAPGADEALVYRKRVIWAVTAVARRLLGDKPCLTQSLAAQRLLRQGGLDADLRIGVTMGEERELLAHAWLEQQGRVIIGGHTSPAKYTPLAPVHTSAA